MILTCPYIHANLLLGEVPMVDKSAHVNNMYVSVPVHNNASVEEEVELLSRNLLLLLQDAKA